MREIVLDTETTGLDPKTGHRVVEIGAIELVNRFPTGQTYHVYLDPERDMPEEARAVHGLSSEFLRGKPTFGAVAEAFQAFIADAVLVIHNAAFDVGFLNAELLAIGAAPIASERVVDTLMLARQRHPMGPNNLDALCRRYGIDNSRRTHHGALFDAELLADVYIELTGGRQAALGLSAAPKSKRIDLTGIVRPAERPFALPPRLTEEERARHAALVESLGPNALWLKSGVS